MKKNGLLYTASAIAVLVLFQIIYGFKILIPTNVSWLMTAMHDWGTHYLGWFFFRTEPWHFPIGYIHGYYYPLGTNVGFTDSIPLMAIFFKLFAPILPADFQYFGIWFLSCHLLAGYFTIRLLGLFKTPPFYVFLAVLLVAANPVLVYRGMHPALCAHWLLIASLYVYFLHPSDIKASRILFYQFILLIIAALVNPYLFFMVLGFSVAIPLKLYFYQRSIGIKYLFSYLFFSIFSVLIAWWIVGLISFGKKENLAIDGGYGLLSMNLNALYDSWGVSALFPALKRMSDYQYEGFMYLGLGMFFLLFILLLYAVFALVKRNKWFAGKRPALTANETSLVPLLILLLLLAFFSITHVVTLNDRVLFRIPLPAALIRLGNVFRASGRFFWAPYYTIIFFAFVVIAKSRIPRGIKVFILVSALFLQFYDTRNLLTSRHLTYGAYIPPINQDWKTIMTHFDRVIFYPPFQTDYLKHLDYQFFCYFAVQTGKPINIGYVARADNDALRSGADSLESDLNRGTLDPKTLYVTTAPYLPQFYVPLQSKKMQLNILDGYYYLFDKAAADPALSVLAAGLNARSTVKPDSLSSALIDKRIEFTTSGPIGPANDSIIYNTELVMDGEVYLHIRGWAFAGNKQNNKGDSVFAFLHSGDRYYLAATNSLYRPDVTSAFKAGNLDSAGFESIIFKDKVEKGVYKLGIAIRDSTGKWIYRLTDHEIKAGISELKIPEKLAKEPAAASIQVNPEGITADAGHIQLTGWAFFRDQDADHSEISILLKYGSDLYICPTDPVSRPDVTAAFKSKYRLEHSGYSAKFLKKTLPPGRYKLGIFIRDPGKKEGVVWTDKEIDIN